MPVHLVTWLIGFEPRGLFSPYNVDDLLFFVNEMRRFFVFSFFVALEIDGPLLSVERTAGPKRYAVDGPV